MSCRVECRLLKPMRVQIAAWLLCLVIVGGAIDTLPDPPAVKPQSLQKNLIPQLDDHVAVTAENQALESLACAVHIQAGTFSFGQSFEDRQVSYDLTFVRQATDTSPPFFN
jgi:hypothetical protein